MSKKLKAFAATKATRREPAPRVVRHDDLWAAIRGLGMWNKTKSQLLALAAEHESKDLFSSKVVAKAARQVAATKRS